MAYFRYATHTHHRACLRARGMSTQEALSGTQDRQDIRDAVRHRRDFGDDYWRGLDAAQSYPATSSPR